MHKYRGVDSAQGTSKFEAPNQQYFKEISFFKLS